MLSHTPYECLGAYIISMASSASDILSVMPLQKEAGMKQYLRIVPLFETLQDLNNSELVMKVVGLYTGLPSNVIPNAHMSDLMRPTPGRLMIL